MRIADSAGFVFTMVAALAAYGQARADDETEDIVEVRLDEHPDYASLESSDLQAVSALFFERCGVEADEGALERAATDWNNLRAMGYGADRLVDIAGRFPDPCEFVSMRGAVVAVEKPPRPETRSGGRRRDPLRNQAALMKGIGAGEVAITGLWGVAHGVLALRLARFDAEEAIDPSHRPWAQAVREGHLYSAVFVSVRVIPLIAAAELTRRTLRGEPRDVGAPFVILGGLDLLLGGFSLVSAIRSTRDRPILDAWDSLQHLSSFSAMVFFSGAILFTTVGAIELVAGLAGSPRPGFERETTHRGRRGTVLLQPLPGGLLLQGSF
jgi:hypothetical protein